MITAANDTLLSRHPILDQEQELVGYELAFQNDVPSKNSRSATLVCAAYAELGLHGALGRNRAFLPADEAFLHDDAIEALPADSVVLGLEFTAPPDANTLSRCRTLRERHYSFALSDYTGLDARSTPLLTLVDVVKISVPGQDDARLGELAGPLARLPVKLLAQGVDTRDTMERCRSLGFQLFQGNYFADTEVVSGRRLSASQASLIRLINLAGRDADTACIEDDIKREPALAVNLLRIVNSVGYGMSRRIGSVRQAITVLGRRQLQRWLQLLLLTPEGTTPDPGRSPLLQVAALRGRMMEMLIARAQPRNTLLADQAFITGIMSIMPLALGLPMDEILAQIALEAEVAQALTSGRGELGRALGLVECFDQEDAAGCDARLTHFSGVGIDRAWLNHCLAESLGWVNDGSR